MDKPKQITLGINHKNVVYVSYAQNDVSNPHVADIVCRFVELFKHLNINYRIDVENNDNSVYDFIKQFEKAKNIIIVLSDKYFRSRNCMIEWLNIQGNNENKRIVYIKYDEENIVLENGIVLSQGFDLDNPDYVSLLEKVWEEKKAKWHNKTAKEQSSEIEKRNAKDNFYLSVFPSINNLIKNSVCYKTSILNAEFDDVESNQPNIKQIISAISS